MTAVFWFVATSELGLVTSQPFILDEMRWGEMSDMNAPSHDMLGVQELQQQAPLRPLTGDKFEACVVCADRASGMFPPPYRLSQIY